MLLVDSSINYFLNNKILLVYIFFFYKSFVIYFKTQNYFQNWRILTDTELNLIKSINGSQDLNYNFRFYADN